MDDKNAVVFVFAERLEIAICNTCNGRGNMVEWSRRERKHVENPDYPCETCKGSRYVTCKVGEEKYMKHFLGLSDNVTYFSEQLEAVPVDPFHYRVIFKPETIIPDIDLQISEGK